MPCSFLSACSFSFTDTKNTVTVTWRNPEEFLKCLRGTSLRSLAPMGSDEWRAQPFLDWLLFRPDKRAPSPPGLGPLAQGAESGVGGPVAVKARWRDGDR